MATASFDVLTPPAGPVRHRITVEDFHRMSEAGILRAEDRTELINGEVFDMSPIGRLHAALVASLSAAFHESFGRTFVIWTQNPIRMGSISELQPDIAILSPRADFYSGDPPGPADVKLLVEVADSSLDHDLTVKVPLYARHGIPEVWVIEAAGRRTHRFRLPTATGYAERLVVAPEELLDFTGFRRSMQSLLPPTG